MAKKGFQVKKLSPSQFRVDYDGSHFIMETLNKELDSEEVKKFMLFWMDDSLEQVRGMVAPEVLHMLQKLPAN